MKLNNKGFAISAILYSVLILFMLVLVAYLTILSGTRKFNTKTLSSISETLKEKIIEINQVLDQDNYYITPLSGNYLIETPTKKGYIYLPKNTTIQNQKGNIIFNNEQNNIINLDNINENETKYLFNNIIDSNEQLDEQIKIVSVYASKKK